MTRFLAAYPDVAVGLALTDRVAHFLDDQIDVAIRIVADARQQPDRDAPGLGPAGGARQPQDLPAHGVPATPDDLSRHSVISLESVSSPTSWRFRSGDDEATVTFRARLSVNTIDAAIMAGLSGAGLVRALSYQVVDYVRSGRLAIVLELVRAAAAAGAPRL